MVQKTNLTIAKKFKKAIKKIIHIDNFILFGSRAKGNFDEQSDFDILIVSKDFENLPWHKRPVKLYLEWNEDFPIELLCYTPEEFNLKKKQISIVQQAIKEGIEI